MKALITTLATLFLLSFGGCLIPMGSSVSSGHRHTAEALAFLDDPGVTREEVIATLGEPLLDSKSTRTLVFLWEEMPRYLFLRPSRALSDHPGVSGSVEYGGSEQYALFVAYDEQGRITAHEDRFVDTGSLEEACANWSKR